MTPTLPLAFTAGVLSFLSPCVLPLVPSYLAYVGGSGAHARATRLRNGLLFILGFSMVFMALGASASALGSVLRQNREWLTVGGGLLVILFALVLLGVIRVPMLMRDTRVQTRHDASTPWGAVLLGMAFAAGWTPCIGPVLGGILTLAGAQGTLPQGVALLGAYALGLGVPFFLATLALDAFARFSRAFRRWLPWVERGSGALLLVAGVLMVTGTYTRINGWLLQFTPDWLYSRL